MPPAATTITTTAKTSHSVRLRRRAARCSASTALISEVISLMSRETSMFLPKLRRARRSWYSYSFFRRSNAPALVVRFVSLRTSR